MYVFRSISKWSLNFFLLFYDLILRLSILGWISIWSYWSLLSCLLGILDVLRYCCSRCWLLILFFYESNSTFWSNLLLIFIRLNFPERRSCLLIQGTFEKIRFSWVRWVQILNHYDFSCCLKWTLSVIRFGHNIS